MVHNMRLSERDVVCDVDWECLLWRSGRGGIDIYSSPLSKRPWECKGLISYWHQWRRFRFNYIILVYPTTRLSLCKNTNVSEPTWYSLKKYHWHCLSRCRYTKWWWSTWHLPSSTYYQAYFLDWRPLASSVTYYRGTKPWTSEMSSVSSPQKEPLFYIFEIRKKCLWWGC